jgi:hypothetical protein
MLAGVEEIINPLHPDIIPRLDPEFAAFYNANSATQPGPHQVPWDPAIRKKPPVAGGSKPLPVGSVKDFALSNCSIRVFWPEDIEKAPEGGWPILLYFHGGKHIKSIFPVCYQTTYVGDQVVGLSETSTQRITSLALCA